MFHFNLNYKFIHKKGQNLVLRIPKVKTEKFISYIHILRAPPTYNVSNTEQELQIYLSEFSELAACQEYKRR